MNLFVFGLGYSTTGIARQAQQQGRATVTSTSRQPERFQHIASTSHRIVRFDPGHQLPLGEEGLAALQEAHYVVSSIPPVAAKLYDPVLAAQHTLLRQLVAKGGHCLHGIGYLSSTGVYGDWAGAWVDESSEPRTATARGLVRLEAEQAWAKLALQLQLPLTIFRLGGIYGPRRSLLDSVQAQAPAASSTARRRAQQRFTSRTHVADVAQAVQADMTRRMGARGLNGVVVQPQKQQQQQQQQQQLVDVINVVDDEPAPRSDVEACARQLLAPGDDAAGTGTGTGSTSATVGATAAGSSQGPGPHGAQPQQGAAAAGGSQGSGQRGPEPLGQAVASSRRPEPLEEKRVRNSKLKQLLQEQLQAGLLAPTYREGLRMIHGGSTLPFDAADLECLFDG